MSNIDWTKVEITHKAFGREGQLAKLNRTRNDYTKSVFVRQMADTTFKKIQRQLEDKKLMAMRERLIKAAEANDEYEMVKIQQQMRAYEGEDMETGSYYQQD